MALRDEMARLTYGCHTIEEKGFHIIMTEAKLKTRVVSLMSLLHPQETATHRDQSVPQQYSILAFRRHAGS